MNLSLFKNWIRTISARVKSDTLELVRNASKWKKAQRKDRKPLNIWVAVFLLGISILAFYLALPMFAGIISIVFKEANPSRVPSVSQEALTGLVVVSTALGAFVLWFAEHPSGRNKTDKGIIKYIGKLFLFAVLAFSLFMLVSPLLPDIRSKTDFYSNFLKYVTAISFIGGGISFAIADVLGLVYLWKF